MKINNIHHQRLLNIVVIVPSLYEKRSLPIVGPSLQHSKSTILPSLILRYSFLSIDTQPISLCFRTRWCSATSRTYSWMKKCFLSRIPSSRSDSYPRGNSFYPTTTFRLDQPNIDAWEMSQPSATFSCLQPLCYRNSLSYQLRGNLCLPLIMQMERRRLRLPLNHSQFHVNSYLCVVLVL